MFLGKTFLARFLTGQRAKGAHLGPLFAILEQLAQAEPQPQDPAPAWLVSSAELGRSLTCPPRTVQQLAAERITARADFDAPPVVVRLVQAEEQAVRTLTACLDDAPCRESAQSTRATFLSRAPESSRPGPLFPTLS